MKIGMKTHYLDLRNQQISLNTIRAIVCDGERVIFLLLNNEDMEVSYYSFEKLKEALVGNYGFSRQIDVVGRTLGTKRIKDNGAPYPALINISLINKVAEEDWEGRIYFTDGSWLENTQGYQGMLDSLNLPTIEIE
ncbi:hypothetical protein ACFSR7_05965 [Cohnella sp. GCM10020058]|uniref:hypothetical protein n=1 Tax=Cohnella sp. GCM10020058 TaxID=3317330 RepID=UPI003637A160